MQIDWKHILFGVLGMAISAGLTLATQHGIQFSCPAPQASPVAQVAK